MVFHALTFARYCGSCWKARSKTVVFNTSQGTWRMLMHWKTIFDHYYCIKTENICYILRYFLHFFVSPFSLYLENIVFVFLNQNTSCWNHHSESVPVRFGANRTKNIINYHFSYHYVWSSGVCHSGLIHKKVHFQSSGLITFFNLLCCLGRFSNQQNKDIFFYFFLKGGFDISCKCQRLFSGKKLKNNIYIYISNYYLLNSLPIVLSVFQILTLLIGLDKRGYQANNFLISRWKRMLWVLIRSTSARCF